MKEELNEQAIEKLSNFLKNIDDKKSTLFSYWMKDYINYLEYEDNFKPNRLIKYKKGMIIKVNLGFNVGSECGGLHYCVVIENKNHMNSPVITVAPLTSTKEKVDVDNLPHSNLFISDELKLLLKSKIYQSIKFLQNEIKSIEKSDCKDKERIKYLRKKYNSCSKMAKEYKRMKNGSIILLNQITTISKMRIYDPKNNNDILYGIKLSNNTLDEIDNKIKEIFIKY